MVCSNRLEMHFIILVYDVWCTRSVATIWWIEKHDLGSEVILELITKTVTIIAYTKVQEQMSIFGSMMTFLGDQEIGFSNSSSGCSGQEVLGFREEFGEEVDAQGAGIMRGGEST